MLLLVVIKEDRERNLRDYFEKYDKTGKQNEKRKKKKVSTSQFLMISIQLKRFCLEIPHYFWYVAVYSKQDFLCSPGPPGTPSLDHAGLELRDPPVSASQGLGSKTDTTTPTLETSHYLLAGKTTVRKDPSQQDVQFTGSQGAQRDEQGGQGGLTVEEAVRTGRLLWI